MTARTDPPDAATQPARFLLLYALAVAGGAVAYVPFLTVLLPVRVTAMAEPEAVAALARIAFAGAIAASIANIAFGWLSDHTRMRRPWIAAGLALSSLLLVSVREAGSQAALIAVIVVWQVALNMMLAPLSAWAGDCVPDRQKGFLGGLLSLAPALGALSGAIVTLPGLAGPDTRLVLVAALVVLMVAPVLLFGGGRIRPELMVDEPLADRPLVRLRTTRAARMWLARLLIQIAEAALFAYLLLWFLSIDAGFGDNDTATIFSIVLFLAVPVALLAGRWSDRANRPIKPLIAAALVAAAGLTNMALAESLAIAIAGYVVFGLAASVFLALHTAQTLRVLPRPTRRGRDLGIFNLTNTVPSLIMPWLTLALVPAFGFDALFALLACLALAAALLLLTVREHN